MLAPLVDLVLEVYIIIHAKLGMLLDPKAFINIVYKHRITGKDRTSKCTAYFFWLLGLVSMKPGYKSEESP